MNPPLQNTGQPPRRTGPAFVESALAELEAMTVPARPRRPFGLLAVGALAILTGAAILEDRRETQEQETLRARVDATESELLARTGELHLARLELDRLNRIHRKSATYEIPADLATAIHDIAVAEGIDPDLAFSLVRVESQFAARAVSPVGAVGLTQVMPATAFELEPGLRHNDLFDERTNLRLGFRYLQLMIRQYRGDLRLALLAYNRGPARVDSIRRSGGNPGNGYANKVLGSID